MKKREKDLEPDATTTIPIKVGTREHLRQYGSTDETWDTLLNRMMSEVEHPKEEPKLDESEIIQAREETKERLRQYSISGESWTDLLNRLLDDIDRHSKEAEQLIQHANEEKFKRIELQMALDEAEGKVEAVPEPDEQPLNVESLDEKLEREKKEAQQKLDEAEEVPMTDEDWEVD